jgi:hypothetical protein
MTRSCNRAPSHLVGSRRRDRATARPCTARNGTAPVGGLWPSDARDGGGRRSCC